MSGVAETIDLAVEAVARALCRQDGHDPDAMHETGEVAPMVVDRMAFIGPELKPRWQHYVGEAARFRAAYAALRVLDGSR